MDFYIATYFMDHLDYDILPSKLALAVKHYGKDKNGINVNTHIHCVLYGKRTFIEYNNYLQYLSDIDECDIPRFYKYLTNNHCSYEVLFKDDTLDLIAELGAFKNDKTSLLDLLISEITINADAGITKSHSYYLRKYGKAYLYNQRKLREMFDSSSTYLDEKK